jgi:hypothetical protein
MSATERKREQRRNEGTAETLAISDRRGRLPGERSGEADRKYGQSELERIVAAQDRDESGRRVRPGGAGPTSDHDTTADAADNSTFDIGIAKEDLRAQYMNAEEYRKFENKITRIGEWFIQQTPDGLRCRLLDCHAVLNTAEDQERHVWQAYTRGHQQHAYIEQLKEMDAPQSLIDDINRRLQMDHHFRKIMELLKSRKRTIS